MRRIFRVLITVVFGSVVVAVPSAQSAADDETATHYHLALGGSVAALPNAYVRGVHAALAETDRKLALTNNRTVANPLAQRGAGRSPRGPACAVSMPGVTKIRGWA
jgi:hypothetical protein